MDESNLSARGASLTHTYDEFTTQFIAFAPQLAGAITLLVAGWVVAHAFRVGTRKLVRSFDWLFQNAERTDDAKQRQIKLSYAVIISKLVFRMVVIFLIAVAANMLGWNIISSWMAGIGVYIPNLITGLVIILAGFLLGNVTAKAVAGGAVSAGLDHAGELGRIMQLVITFMAGHRR